MNILHIAYMDSGGAGRATLRLHKSLQKLNGVESKVLCLYKNTNEKEVYKFNLKKSLIYRVLIKIKLIKSYKERNRELLQSFARTFFIYTFPITDYAIHKHPLVRSADIIHLHWVSGFIDYQTFFKKVQKPIVWTIHDKNPTLGGFHLLLDKIRNTSLPIGKLNSKHEDLKFKALSYVQKMIVVAPSRFLSDYASNSRLLGQFEHQHIYNSIETDVFKPYDQCEVRRKFNMPKDRTVFLFLSEGIEHQHKGADLLIDALKLVKEDFILVTVGRGVIEGVKNVVSLGLINNDTILAQIYSAVDAAILPSREDNLPNVMLEAMACGTPVIGTSVGGIVDVIKNGHNGILSNKTEVAAIADAINHYISNKKQFDKIKIRQLALETFSMEKQAKQYNKLYQQMINSKPDNLNYI